MTGREEKPHFCSSLLNYKKFNIFASTQVYLSVACLRAVFLSSQKLLTEVFFKGNQSCDTPGYGFGAKFLQLKMPASRFSHGRTSALKQLE